MRTIQLGQSKLKVSRLIYGSEPFNLKKGPDGDRKQGDKTPEQAAEILKEALELGVNVWDTSDDYGTQKAMLMSPGDWRSAIRPFLAEI